MLYFYTIELYNSLYCATMLESENRLVFSRPKTICSFLVLSSFMILIMFCLILSTLKGFTYYGAVPAISDIGGRFDVMTALPVAFASIMGIPNPSYSEQKLIMSALLYS